MRFRSNILYPALFILTALLALILWKAPHSRSDKELIIYDVHTDNPRIVKDDGSIEYADYLRIKNMTSHPYDMSGLFLSDSRKDHDKLPLDGIIIESGQSVMIRLDPSWNFALKRDGDENIYLSDRAGNILFKYNKSMKPPAPKLSADSGFYDEEFDLKLSVKGDYTIRYTLDGCEPKEDSCEYGGPLHVYDRSSEANSVVNIPNTVKNYLDDRLYDESTGEYVPVEKPNDTPVDKAFIIRAAAFDEYGNKSDTVTREYFFCGDKYKSIISVVADRNDLFGPRGIVSVGSEYDEWYTNGMEGDEPEVNFEKKGKNWEIPAQMDLFKGRKNVLTQKCGLKLQGRTTRQRRIKNFQLRARNRYSGSDVFDYDFFDNEEYRSDGIILDDCFNESVFLALIEDEEIIKQRTTDRVALFINGEFWNNVYIRQKLDERYFEDHYGVSPDNLLVMAESFPETKTKDEASYELARELYLSIDEFARDNDLSIPENYEKIGSMMDIDSFIDYLAINTWAGNKDWAQFENDMYWRVWEPYDSSYGDGRFRWIIHDGDDVFYDKYEILDGHFIGEGNLFTGLMKNPDFRESFAQRLEELGTTSFSEENIAVVLDSGNWDEPEAKEVRKFFEDRNRRIESVVNKYVRPGDYLN